MNHRNERDNGGSIDELAQKLVERRIAAAREASRQRAEKKEDAVFRPFNRQERLSISTMLEDQLGRHGFITEKCLDPYGGPGAIYTYTKGNTPVKIVAMHNICDVDVAIMMPIFSDAGDDFEVTPGIIHREGEAPALYSKRAIQIKDRDDASGCIPEILELFRMGEVRFSEKGGINGQTGAEGQEKTRAKARVGQQQSAWVRRAEAHAKKAKVGEQIYLKQQLRKIEYRMHRVRIVIAAIGLVAGPVVFNGIRIDEMVMSGREKPEEHIVDGEVYPNIRTMPPEIHKSIEESGEVSGQEEHPKVISVIDIVDAIAKSLALAAIGTGIVTAMYEVPMRSLRKRVRESMMEDKDGAVRDGDKEDA